MNLHHQDPQENPCVCVECDLFGHFGVTSLLQECYLCGQWKLNYCTLARWHCCAKPFDVASQESLSQLPCQISPSLRRVGLGNRPYYRRLSSWRKKGHHPPILTKKKVAISASTDCTNFCHLFFEMCPPTHKGSLGSSQFRIGRNTCQQAESNPIKSENPPSCPTKAPRCSSIKRLK